MLMKWKGIFMKLFASLALVAGLAFLAGGCDNPNKTTIITQASITSTEIVKAAKTGKAKEVSVYQLTADKKKNLLVIVGKVDELTITSTDKMTVNGKPMNFLPQTCDDMVFVCYIGSKGPMMSSLAGVKAKEFEPKCKATPINDVVLDGTIQQMEATDERLKGGTTFGGKGKPPAKKS